MIIQNNQLDHAQFNLLQGLISRCKLRDGSVPAFYPYLLTQRRAVSSNLLYFKNKNLIGFLSTFFFFEHGCEIALVVDPAYRQQSIAKKLLQKILPLLTGRLIETVIFSSSSHQDNDNWLSRIGFEVHHTEFQMQRVNIDPVPSSTNKLRIVPASLEEISHLAEIDKACFPASQDNFIRHFENLLSDPNYSIFLGLFEDKIIGKSHIRWNSNSATLSDIAVFPENQNQGFGKELVAYCINLALNFGKKKLILDVEPSNEKAVQLYSKFGFKISEDRTFWTIPLEKLKTLIS